MCIVQRPQACLSKIVQHWYENEATIYMLMLETTGKTCGMMLKGYLNVHVKSYRANKRPHVTTSSAQFAAVPLDVFDVF